jgi:hypothetical protein
MKRCEIHGRIYDAGKEPGCPLCIQEGLVPSEPGAIPPPHLHSRPPEAPKSPVATYVVLGLALLALLGTGYWTLFRKDQPTKAQLEYAARRAEAAAMAPSVGDTTKFTAPGDLTPVRHARALSNALEGLIRANRGALLRFAEGNVDTAATDRAAKARVKQWTLFARHWHATLDNVTRNGTDFRYGPGVKLTAQMDQVSNALGATVSVLNDAVPPLRVKSRTERNSDLRTAQGYLAGARTILSNLPK